MDVLLLMLDSKSGELLLFGSQYHLLSLLQRRLTAMHGGCDMVFLVREA